MKSLFFTICIALTVMGLGHRAMAQVTYIGHFKVTTYNQTQATPPTAPSGYYCGISLNSDPDYNISLPMIFIPSDTNPEVIMNENGPQDFGFGSPVYTNKINFDADYPNAVYDYFIDYTFETNTDVQSEDLFVQLPATDMYSPDIPAFTPDVFTNMQAVDPSQDFVLEWLPYEAATNASFAHTFIGSYDNQTFDSRYGGFNFDCDPDITSVVMPAGSLDYGCTYGFNLFYSDRQSPPFYNSDDSSIFLIIGFDNLVTAYLTTIGPNLQIAALTNSKIQLTWPALASNNYQLQTTRDLSTGNWCDVTNTPTINGSLNTLCLPACHTAAFFRLEPLSL